MWRAINARDRQEIDNIGLVLADFDRSLDGRPVVVEIGPIPEPAGLLALGLLVVAARRRQRGIKPRV